MSDEEPMPRVRGMLRLDGDNGVVRIEMCVDAAPTTVWAAVTEPERLAGWAGEINGSLRQGGEYEALLFPSGWEGTGRVLECEPGRRWLVEGAEADRPTQSNELVLVPGDDDTGTTVILTEAGIAADMLAFHGVGVQIHVENLAAYLAGRGPVDPDVFWDSLLPEYQRLASELSETR
jgi:uncharacterized protein YndB with AHSA1/START domain